LDKIGLILKQKDHAPMNETLRYRGKYSYDYQFVVPKLMCSEVWPIRDLVCTKDQVIFDVGASHGAWTKAWVDAHGLAVKEVHMFEPMPANIAELKHKFAEEFFDEYGNTMSTRLILNETGLAAHSGMQQINSNAPTSGLASFAQTECILPDRIVKLDSSIEVPINTLTNYFKTTELEFAKTELKHLVPVAGEKLIEHSEGMILS
jgi:FkbM family methyltransferase